MILIRPSRCRFCFNSVVKSIRPTQLSLAATLKHLANLMGLLQQNPLSFLQTGLDNGDKAAIEQLIIERTQARAERNWAKSDKIRDELLGQGIELEDGVGGTTWRKITE